MSDETKQPEKQGGQQEKLVIRETTGSHREKIDAAVSYLQAAVAHPHLSVSACQMRMEAAANWLIAISDDLYANEKVLNPEAQTDAP